MDERALMAKMDLLYHLNLLVQDVQCKLNCLLCLVQYIPFLFAHTVKSRTRSYMSGNK